MTAEEFIKNNEDYYMEIETSPILYKAMIEFAKMHVKKALEAALEDAPTGSSTDIPSYEEMKDAILNAYPLTNVQ